MKRVRKGSLADKAVKTCNWLDNSKAGKVIGGVITSGSFMALMIYGMHCTHPFM